MKETTKRRKKATRGMEEACGRQEILEQMYEIYAKGKVGFDVYMKELGRMMAETIMYIDREEIAGPDYQPLSPDIQKWASQPGSVYIGDQKIKVQHPRLRGPEGEIALKSYEKLKEREQFSQELLNKVLRGISCRKYAETVVDVAGAFGVSAGSVSRHIVEATAKQLREFKERELSGYKPFAIFLDTIHRGGEAFIIGLGINTEGTKKV